MDLLRAGLPGQYGAGTNAPPPPPPKDEAAERIRKAKERKARRRKILIVTSVIVVLLVVGSTYYYIEDSPYATAVVSTSTTTGIITGINNASVQLTTQSNSASPNARLTISTSYGTFSAFIGCWPAPYKVGQNTTVTVNTLRNGGHSYSAPKLACKGGGFQFQSSTTTTKTSTH